MANLCPVRCGTGEGPHHYRQRGQHRPAALSPPVTYLSAMAGDNYSAGNRGGRENAKEPHSPALGLQRSAERQRGHSRVPLAISRASTGRGGRRPCRCVMSACCFMSPGRGGPQLVPAVGGVLLPLRWKKAYSLSKAPSKCAGLFPKRQRDLLCPPGWPGMPAGYPPASLPGTG